METHEIVKTRDTHKGRRKHKMERKVMVKHVRSTNTRLG